MCPQHRHRSGTVTHGASHAVRMDMEHPMEVRGGGGGRREGEVSGTGREGRPGTTAHGVSHAARVDVKHSLGIRFSMIGR